MLSYENTIVNENIINENSINENVKFNLPKQQLPWVEKYRPKKIDNIISHQEIIQSLKKFIQKRTLPHLLFFGPSGSGKTTTIMCCAYEIYHNYTDCMVLQLNASNERGIETVRTKIKNFVYNKNSIFVPEEIRGVFKLVILDEIDSMTVEAQGMLRQTIEKNSSTTRFCLICNEIDKINIALQSRCALFRFSPLNSIAMKNRLETICRTEKIAYDIESIDSIVKISDGDMRFAINMLQSINLTIDKKITNNNVYKLSGHCMPEIISNIFKILSKITEKKINLMNSVRKIVNIVNNNNITIFNLLEELKNIIIESKFNIQQKIFLIDNFAKNEVYDSVNVDSKIIIMNIASLFVLVDNIK